MAIIIDEDVCVSCGACVEICPTGALSMSAETGKSQVEEDDCIVCGACVNDCPVEAITLPESDETESLNAAGNGIWVMVEFDEAKKPLGVSYELMGQARKLADKSGESCAAVIIAEEEGDFPQSFIAAGADRVYVITGEEYAHYNTELFTNAFCELAKVYKPGSVLFPATVNGRDLAPRVAARLKTGLCADCTSLDINEEGLVDWTRPALGGNILATILCEESRPQMGTIRPKVFRIPEADTSRKGEVVHYTVQNPIDALVKLLKCESIATDDGLKIEEAIVVFAGGRGMGNAENFHVLEELASLFEKGAVAGSRAAVDEKWVDHASQVGQSGKTIAPTIYFACGISGAIQHTSGMKDSDVIIAINKDPKAPIFDMASYGIVGDANVILPALYKKIKAFKEA